MVAPPSCPRRCCTVAARSSGARFCCVGGPDSGATEGAGCPGTPCWKRGDIGPGRLWLRCKHMSESYRGAYGLTRGSYRFLLAAAQVGTTLLLGACVHACTCGSLSVCVCVLCVWCVCVRACVCACVHACNMSK